MLPVSHWFLALACATLLLVIAAQDYLYAPLRNKTISAGLTGQYHAVLDVSYVLLSVMLVVTFRHHVVSEVIASISAVALLVTAASNTAWRWFDSMTHGKHAMIHSDATLVVFSSALALQVINERLTLLWVITGLTIWLAGLVYVFFRYERTDIDGTVISASPAAEKVFVLGLCTWLIVWSLAK